MGSDRLSNKSNKLAFKVCEKYYHGLSLDNWFPCWNLRIDDKLRSADTAIFDPDLKSSHIPLREMEIDELSKGGFRGVAQPRLVSALADRKKWIIEIEFEKGRRQFNAEAPCRLSCLYLAEYSSGGKKNIKEMLPGYSIYTVRISFLARLCRVDRVWFDKYYEEPSSEFIRNYWLGISSQNPKFEFLLDGVIQFIDKDELLFLRQHAVLPPGCDKSFLERFDSKEQ